MLALSETWNALVTTALTALRQAQAAVTAALRARDLAQAAVTAAGAGATPGQQQALTDAEAALAAAQAALIQAAVDYVAAAGPQAVPGTDRAAMLDALTSTADGAPAMRAIGVDTIAACLGKNSYAVFIKRLLES